MIAGKLIYAALLVVLVLFLILYRGALSLQLLIFALAFPIILRILLSVQSRKMAVQLRAAKRRLRKGEPFDWMLLVRNNSSIPAVQAQVLLEYRSSLAGLPQNLTVEIPVRPNNTHQVRLTFHAATSGVMDLKLKALRLYDPLHLFSVKRPLRDSSQVMVLPEPAVLPDWLPSAPEIDDSPEYSKVKPGDDPSEIFDFHVYREGDPITRIHWKLSSKLDDLMVKEFSLPIAGQTVLVPFYCLTAAQPEAAIRLDAMLAMMSGAAQLLTDAELSASLMLLSKLTAVPFTDFEDYYDAMTALLRTDPVSEELTESLVGQMFRLQEIEHQHDSLLVFLPKLDAGILSQLSGLPHPERITVFAAASAEEKLPADMLLPFPLYRADLDELLPEWERKLLPAPVPEGGAA
ncbi:MAG: DUF58 domain-containing protein [Oscillospiraceae bacterium]|nr:DUF58 domain-containing protein [Oscillospiraceae bacterium]